MFYGDGEGEKMPPKGYTSKLLFAAIKLCVLFKL